MGGAAVMVGGGGFVAIGLGLTVLVLRRRATGHPRSWRISTNRRRPCQHRTLASQKRSRPSPKRFNPQPSNPSQNRQGPNVDLRFQRAVCPPVGRKSSGNTMVNNTLMGHCESGLLWPVSRHGTHFGSSSLFWGIDVVLTAISPSGFKRARTTALLGTHPCSPCCCGHGFNFEVVVMEALAGVDHHLFGEQYPCRTPVWWARTGSVDKDPGLPGVSGRRVVVRIPKQFGRIEGWFAKVLCVHRRNSVDHSTR